MTEYPVEIECGCEKKKTFPLVLRSDETQEQGSTTQEVECPFCQELLTVSLPVGTVPRDTTLYRSYKKAK